jgi:rod shape-determining protein MreD
VREALVLLAAGIASLALESALLAHLPTALVPALSLLCAIAAALLLGPLTGMLVSAVLGFGADMLSGALLGQHAFLRLVEFALVRSAVDQFDLVRPFPFALLALAVALVDAAGSAALIEFFLGSFAADPRALGAILLRAVVTAITAPLALALARRVVAWGGGEGDVRREMRLETKRPVL